MNDRELFHAMDACRPGSDDVDMPEMQALKARLASDPKWQQTWQHLQRLDGELADRLRDVPMPSDLRQRVLNRLAEPRVGATTRVSQKKQGIECELSPPAGRLRRPKLILTAVGLLATAACLLLVLHAVTRSVRPATDRAQLASWAVDEWMPDAKRWKDYQVGRRSELYPLSGYVRTKPVRWQQIRTELDRRTVVFELPASGRASQIRLFVLHVPERLTELPTRPPSQPWAGTRGWSTAAWQEVPHLYVLAIEGAAEDYFEVVRAGPPALAAVYPDAAMVARMPSFPLNGRLAAVRLP